MATSEKDSLGELILQAKNGDAVAQNILGARLITGEQVEKDVHGGFYWYCQAIKKGYVHAMWNAGSMLVDGDEGIEKNRELGMRLIEEAANANENSACLFISQCYSNGIYGKEIDRKLAKHWEQRAWDCENEKEFGQPIDIEREYNLKLKKPNG